MTERSTKDNFLIQGSILAVTSILVRLIGIIYRIPMTHIVGDEGMGYYEQAFEIYNIAYILSAFSLPTAVSKLVAARNIKREYTNAFRIFVGALLFSVFFGGVISAAIFFGADFIAAVLFGQEFVAIPLRVLSPAIFICSALGVFRGFYQGKNTMIPTAISQLVEQVINGIVSVGAAWYLMKEHSASDLIAAYGAAGGTLGTVLGALAGLFFVTAVFALYMPTLSRQMKKKDQAGSVESYGYILRVLTVTIVPVVLAQIIFRSNGVLVTGIFNHVMEGKGVPKEEVVAMFGVYGNKYRLLTNVPIAIATAISAAMIPSIVGAKIQGAISEVKKKVAGSIKFNMVIAIPSAVGMAVLASPLLKLVFRDNTELAANLLVVGSAAVVTYALSTVFNAVLQGINQMRIPVIHSAVALVIDLAAIFLLLQFTDLGVYALVIGNVLFPLLVSILNWISVKKHLNYKQEIVKSFCIPFLASIVMGIVAYFLHKGIMLVFPHNLVATLVTILVAAVVYFVLLLLLRGMGEEELHQFPKGRSIAKLAKKLHLI